MRESDKAANISGPSGPARNTPLVGMKRCCGDCRAGRMSLKMSSSSCGYPELASGIHEVRVGILTALPGDSLNPAAQAIDLFEKFADLSRLRALGR